MLFWFLEFTILRLSVFVLGNFSISCRPLLRTVRSVRGARRLVTNRVVEFTSKHFGCNSSGSDFGPILQTDVNEIFPLDGLICEFLSFSHMFRLCFTFWLTKNVKLRVALSINEFNLSVRITELLSIFINIFQLVFLKIEVENTTIYVDLCYWTFSPQHHLPCIVDCMDVHVHRSCTSLTQLQSFRETFSLEWVVSIYRVFMPQFIVKTWVFIFLWSNSKAQSTSE